MNFRQFAIRWIDDNVAVHKTGRTFLFDLAELFDNYNVSLDTMELVLLRFQKLLNAWKEYQNIKIS